MFEPLLPRYPNSSGTKGFLSQKGFSMRPMIYDIVLNLNSGDEAYWPGHLQDRLQEASSSSNYLIQLLKINNDGSQGFPINYDVEIRAFLDSYQSLSKLILDLTSVKISTAKVNIQKLSQNLSNAAKESLSVEEAKTASKNRTFFPDPIFALTIDNFSLPTILVIKCQKNSINTLAELLDKRNSLQQINWLSDFDITTIDYALAKIGIKPKTQSVSHSTGTWWNWYTDVPIPDEKTYKETYGSLLTG